MLRSSKYYKYFACTRGQSGREKDSVSIGVLRAEERGQGLESPGRREPSAQQFPL